ncbi:sugar ABC transporter substrate-binding protein [Bradyrhizobium manausense]
MGKSIVVSALVALGLTTGTVNGQQPDWLPSPLPRPLNQITIGFSTLGSGVNSYVATYYQTFNAYAKELGVKTVVLDSQVDAAKQSDQIRDLIAQKVDVLIAWPVNAKAIVTALRRAHDVGLPVVVTNSQADPAADAYVTTFSGPDHYGEAQAAAEMMNKALNGKGNVVLIGGLPGYTVAQQREKGFLDAIAKYPNIKILDSQPANWSREKAQSVMESYIVRFGDTIDGVYSADSDMGVGALSAVRAAVSEGKLKAGHIKFTDCTLFAAGYDAIKSGDYYGSVLQSPVLDARSALQAAIRIAESQKVEKTLYFDTPAITLDNINQFERPSF